MSFQNVDSANGATSEIFLVTVTGTHSAGKSTLVDSYVEADFTERYSIAPQDPFAIYPRYGGCLLDATAIPIIVCEEAMTARARINRLPELPTTGYTFEDQIEVENFNLTMILNAVGIARRVATVTQPHSEIKRGIVLADRSALDGRVYSVLRTPDRDPEAVDMRRVDIQTLGWDPQSSMVDRTHPVREWHRRFMINYCDLVLFPNHTEVAFEDNGSRQVDQAFREAIAVEMAGYYREVLGEERIVDICGNPQERRMLAIKHLSALVIN